MADDNRIREITEWFDRQGFFLAYHPIGGEWAVAPIPHEGPRIGSAPTAGGATELEAAEALFEAAQTGGVPGVVVTDPAGNVTVHVPTATAGAATPGPTAETAPQLDRVLGHFGWSFWFTNEPDGSRSFIVTEVKTGDVIRVGQPHDHWDDVLLAAITDLYPPSPEGLAG